MAHGTATRVAAPRSRRSTKRWKSRSESDNGMAPLTNDRGIPLSRLRRMLSNILSWQRADSFCCSERVRCRRRRRADPFEMEAVIAY
jgi:hypothetical protein